MLIKLVFLTLSCVIGKSVGQLTCYACSFSVEDTDRSCLTITDDTRQVNCPFRYCTIFRQEFIDPPGTVASFTRGCENAPVYLNHEVEDSTYRTFYRACTNDLCNIGNGIELIGGGSLFPSHQYAGENLLVPGTRNKASSVKSYISITVITVLVISFLQ